MISFEYINEWRLVMKLSIAWPFDQHEVYSALENEDYYGDGDRVYCPTPKSSMLQQILDIVKEESQTLLKNINTRQEFKDKWCLDYNEQLLNNTKLTCMFVCDKPGFSLDSHIDSRLQVCTGMFFFNNFDDIKQSTTFYTTHQGENPIRLSSKYGTGWYAANDQDNWHSGGNFTDRNRYAIILIHKLDLK
jgi:hypothetical protein